MARKEEGMANGVRNMLLRLQLALLQGSMPPAQDVKDISSLSKRDSSIPEGEVCSAVD
jgi:hypothetical protein